MGSGLISSGGGSHNKREFPHLIKKDRNWKGRAFNEGIAGPTLALSIKEGGADGDVLLRQVFRTNRWPSLHFFVRDLKTQKSSK